MLVPLRKMWCLSEPNIDGFFLSSLILQIGYKDIVFEFHSYFLSVTENFHKHFQSSSYSIIFIK